MATASLDRKATFQRSCSVSLNHRESTLEVQVNLTQQSVDSFNFVICVYLMLREKKGL